MLELDGEPAGYALYRIHTKFESGAAAGHVDVIEAVADGPVATRELWRVLLDMDWKATLKAYLLRSTIRSFTSSRTHAGCSCASETVFGCVSSTSAAALSAREYADAGAVVVELDDGFLPENGGRWRVSADTVERTEDEPDVGLGVGELGSVYLGGFGFGELVRAGVVREHREGGAARADALFQTGSPKPWCPEIF